MSTACAVIVLTGWILLVVVALVYTSIEYHKTGAYCPHEFFALGLGWMWPIALAGALLWFCLLRPAHKAIGRWVEHTAFRRDAMQELERELQ